MDSNQIYFKGLIEYLSWYIGAPKTTALDISSEVDTNNLSTLFEVDLKYYLPDSMVTKLKGVVNQYPLKPVCFILGIGFTPKNAEQIIKQFGTSDSLVKVIEENPYELIIVEGISFKKIDKIALEVFNFDENNEFRLKAHVLNELNQASNRGGHLFIELNKFLEGKFEISFNQNDLRKYIKQLLLEKKIYISNNKIYSSSNFKAEDESSKIIANLVKDKKFTSALFEGVDANIFIEGYERIQTQNIANGKWKKLKWSASNFTLSEQQKNAVKKFIQEKFLIVTGLPGTGKTTVTKALVDISRSRSLQVSLMAPTGIAAKRLTEATGFEATTIHKKLGFDGIGYNVNENKCLMEDIFIIDEFSMVDQVLLYNLIKCLPKKEFKLVFIGDHAQLPSVAPGNVLKELLKSKKLPHIELNKIFRQEDTSDIIVNSHLINNGKVELVSNKKDFIFVNISDEEIILNSIVKIVSKFKDNNYQVLSPTYKGILGVTNINNTLQDVVNPTYDDLSFKTDAYNFRKNDKIMILKNDYTNEVYNGEQGIVRNINKSKKILEILINNKVIEYTFNDCYSLITLDYARTVHKSQSQEYDIVIIPWVNSFSIQLQRNLLYTAVTRAKEKVFILGHKQALETAIKNNSVTKRNSIFSSRILSYLENDPEENND
jgi:exodeoxyribonuclease V alpha subunit